MPRHAKQSAEEPHYASGGFDPPYQGAAPPLPPLMDDLPGPDPEPEPEPEVFDYEPIDMAQAEAREGPFHGSPVMISDDESSRGVLAMWYCTRRRVGYAWTPWKMWIDPITREEISFKPKFWRANPNFGAFW